MLILFLNHKGTALGLLQQNEIFYANVVHCTMSRQQILTALMVSDKTKIL